MRSINKVFLMGHVGQDPVVRQTPTGKSVCDLSLATNRSVKAGETWVDEPDWHRLRLWEQRAEVALRYVTRGSAIAIEGQLRTESWTDQQQVRHTRSFVHVENLVLLPSGRPRDEGERPAASPPGERGESTVEDNIPF